MSASYPSGIIIFVIFVAAAILLDQLREFLVRRLSSDHKSTVISVFHQLCTFGLVSTLAFLFEKDWDGQGSIIFHVGERIDMGYGYGRIQIKRFAICSAFS